MCPEQGVCLQYSFYSSASTSLPGTADGSQMLCVQEKVRLKFKISYTLGEEPVTDVGDAEEFPVQ